MIQKHVRWPQAVFNHRPGYLRRSELWIRAEALPNMLHYEGTLKARACHARLLPPLILLSQPALSPTSGAIGKLAMLEPDSVTRPRDVHAKGC